MKSFGKSCSGSCLEMISKQNDMRILPLIPLLLLLPLSSPAQLAPCEMSGKVKKYFNENKGNDKPSKSTGTVSDGKLENGKLVPFCGSNYRYFSSESYLAGRAYLNDKVKKILVDAYKALETEAPGRQFFIMECANKEGGKLAPHNTHQNGLSVDLMMPLVKKKQAYYGLDTTGINHYWLEFDNEGKYSKDKSISIDFELVAKHILLLEKKARENGMKIGKVIIKIELKEELFATVSGKKLKSSGIYFAQNLSSLINSLHDDHFHVDFEAVK